ncbi:hypothetical protein TRVL_03549 [Trypanosoma vivax]|nr:hypothetical protein TRVL_03549 [Trypanosoma vivax]
MRTQASPQYGGNKLSAKDMLLSHHHLPYESRMHVDEGQFILSLYKAVLNKMEMGGLRGVSCNKYTARGGGSSTRVLSAFLTRLYAAASVEKGDGLMGPRQIMPYYNQFAQWGNARVRYFDSIIDLDKGALEEMRTQRRVDEMLLLVFNDWDEDADAFVEVFQQLATSLRPYAEVGKAEYPKKLLSAIKNENEPDTLRVVTTRPNAFDVLSQTETTPVMGTGRNSLNHLFLWPSDIKSASPVQVVAAIRKADFGSDDFFGENTYKMTLQSPGVFFCTRGMDHVQPYNGPPSTEGLYNFVLRHTISHLQLTSGGELLSVIEQYDQLVLIVCKKAEYEERRRSSPLRDVLFRNEELRFRLRAVLPTFFVQMEQMDEAGKSLLRDLKVEQTDELRPESLRFLSEDKGMKLGHDFIEKLRLLPLSSSVCLMVLGRSIPREKEVSNSALSKFSAYALLFPAPSAKTDLVLWGRTFGARLVDMVKDIAYDQPFLRPVDGQTIQEVYERHFNMVYATLHARLRQRQKTTDATVVEEVDYKKLKQNIDGRFLVLVVLSSLSNGKVDQCEEAAAHAMRNTERGGRIMIASLSPKHAEALLEELRFTIWRHYKSTPANNCEVYILNGEGDVRAADITPAEFRVQSFGLKDLFERFMAQSKPDADACMRAAIPPRPDALRSALRKLEKGMNAAGSSDDASAFRSELAIGDTVVARSSLWVPPGEIAPLVVFEQGSDDKKCSSSEGTGAAIVLIHDSSCAATTNSLKAVQLLEECRQNGNFPKSVEFFEYDISDHYTASAFDDKLLHALSGYVNPAVRLSLYKRIKPFLQDAPLLHPPHIFALNSTHMLSTLHLLTYYAIEAGNDVKTGPQNGLIHFLTRLARFVEGSADITGAASCAQQTVEQDQKSRAQFRRISSR